MTRALIALVLFAVPGVAQARSRGLPFQLEAAFGVMYEHDALPAQCGAVWLGVGIPPDEYGAVAEGDDGRLFFAGGAEATFNGSRGPYQWSIGGGQRFGRLWRMSNGPAGPFPDAYLYMRVTPFIGFGSVADEEYLGDEPRVVQRGYGARMGVGLTVPAWPATTMPALGGVDIPSGGGGNDPCAAIFAACVLAMLLDHAELTYELYRAPDGDVHHRAGWRIGIGF